MNGEKRLLMMPKMLPWRLDYLNSRGMHSYFSNLAALANQASVGTGQKLKTIDRGQCSNTIVINPLISISVRKTAS
jgi:hypothetical protein